MKYIVNKTINIDRNEITSIKAVENDMKTRFINFQLLVNNQPLNLTGLTVRVYGKTSKRTEVFNDLNIIDSVKGLVELELTRPFLVAGITEYQLKIYTPDNGVLSSNILMIDVTKDLMNYNSIEASNEYNSIEKAFQQVDNSIDKINTIIDSSVNRVNETMNNLTNKVNEAIEKTKPQELGGEILGITLSYINPTFSDCNYFKEPNKYFTWDTGQGGFNNTPLGDLQIGSAIVFEVINYGREGRIQQEFRQTYPPDKTRKWIRNFTSDSNGKWSDWRPEFLGEKEIVVNDDFNNFTSMGCYKVQNVTGANPNSPQHQLDSSIYNFGLLIVFESGVAEEHRVLQVYYPHQEGGVGHRTPVMRMKNSTAWTDWTYIGATSKDIDRVTTQIASNSSSINDLYSWVNRNIQMEYISGATSLTLQPNKAYYIDGQHVADITHIDHSAIPVGGKVYFYVASGDPLAHIVFRRQGLCNQDVRVWLPKGQDFWIVGNTDGDKIFTMMKIGDAMRFLN